VNIHPPGATTVVLPVYRPGGQWPFNVRIKRNEGKRWQYVTMDDVVLQLGDILEHLCDKENPGGSVPVLRTTSRDGVPLVVLYPVAGRAVVRAGYAFDGPSFGVFRRFIPERVARAALAPSLRHDVGYQLSRLGFLPPDARRAVDEMFRADLVPAITAEGYDTKAAKRWASIFYRGVRLVGWRFF